LQRERVGFEAHKKGTKFMRISMMCGAAAWLTCGVMACGGTQPAASSPTETHAQGNSPPTRGAGEAASDRETVVEVSDEIRAGCGLARAGADSPHFELDESSLRGPDKNLLDDVATCLKEGRLQNRTVTIVGHTDPRGSSEHNQNLGASRADATRNYLVAKGVPEGHLLVMSRGEQGARGNDEQSWALDRRVDLVLRDPTLSREQPPLPPANPPQTNINASPNDTAPAPQSTPVPPANPPLQNVQKSPSGK
jgi:peptidoglycan-associated lipoprotein